MNIRFYTDLSHELLARYNAEPVDVEYGFPTGGAAPAVGDHVEADGTDPQFPAGTYVVVHRCLRVTLRGGPDRLSIKVRPGWID